MILLTNLVASRPAVAKSTAPTRPRWRLRAGHLFVLPYFLFLCAFGLGPAIYALLLSFSKVQFGRPILFQAGFSNFVTAFTDFRFLPSFQNVFSYLAAALPVTVVGVVVLSLLLHVRPSRMADGVRTIYFLPGAVTGPALVLLAIFMFDPTVSPFRVLMTSFGLSSMMEVIRPARLVMLFTIINFFAHSGGWIAIFYGALNGISKEVLEAATMDGCSAWDLATRIKFPLILPYVWYMLILSFAGNVQLFAEPQLIGAALPGVISGTWSLNQLGYEFAFKLGNFGASAAVSLVLLLTGLIAAYVVINFTNFYSTDAES
jgi:multiple sugar transport system permease protein